MTLNQRITARGRAAARRAWKQHLALLTDVWAGRVALNLRELAHLRALLENWR